MARLVNIPPVARVFFDGKEVVQMFLGNQDIMGFSRYRMSDGHDPSFVADFDVDVYGATGAATFALNYASNELGQPSMIADFNNDVYGAV
ncbi:hypothetical protein [Halodurantibacterium flavum]|uniref:Uncharacterized protein n=1 Tax=Halodurantibacterium flavum TaxID=1382802 RepID=A0ABW4SAJ9_9RHOB